ncbi:MAG: RES family NAD+ phosphorylase [Parvibaculaceae bacterium]
MATLWRIASTTSEFNANDMSGAGAARYPGRWNLEGQYVVYAAPSIALAVLETAAHIDDGGLPLNRYVVRIEVPDAAWDQRTIRTREDLPGGWDAIPASLISAGIGAAWYDGGASLLLQIPSVIVPREAVVVIHGKHPGGDDVRSEVLERFEYNRLFRSF